MKTRIINSGRIKAIGRTLLWARVPALLIVVPISLLLSMEITLGRYSSALEKAAFAQSNLIFAYFVFGIWLTWKVGSVKKYLLQKRRKRSTLVTLLPLLVPSGSVVWLTGAIAVMLAIGGIAPAETQVLSLALLFQIGSIAIICAWILPRVLGVLASMGIFFIWSLYPVATDLVWPRNSNAQSLLMSCCENSLTISWVGISASVIVALGLSIVAAMILGSYLVDFNEKLRIGSIVLSVAIAFLGLSWSLTRKLPWDGLVAREQSQMVCDAENGIELCSWPEEASLIPANLQALASVRECFTDFPLVIPTTWVSGSGNPNEGFGQFFIYEDFTAEHIGVVGAESVLLLNGLGEVALALEGNGPESEATIYEAMVVSAWGELTCGVGEEAVRESYPATRATAKSPATEAIRIRSMPLNDQLAWLEGMKTD